jgi:transposase InsO family protein
MKQAPALDSIPAIALRAVLKASHILGLVMGRRIGELRDSGDPLLRSAAQNTALAALLGASREATEILAERWDKVPERHRPHYTPEQRYRILRVKDSLSLSLADCALLFRVSPTSISRWRTEALHSPDAKTVGSLVSPQPPVRRYADVVRELARSLALAGFGGNLTIAQTLARAGIKISRRSVGRMRKEKASPPLPSPETPASEPAAAKRRVKARHPGHVLMADLTDIPALFRLSALKLGLIMDVFSRFPLSFRLFRQEPSAADMATLVEKAVPAGHEMDDAVPRERRSPRHFISDQGSCFTAGFFRAALQLLGLRHRFGAIGKSGSIALIERLWRSLKQRLRSPLARLVIPLDIQRQIELTPTHYAYLRPHQGLGGATPAEVHFGISPAHLKAAHPPRGQPGQVVIFHKTEIRFLDSERRLPFLLSQPA